MSGLWTNLLDALALLGFVPRNRDSRVSGAADLRWGSPVGGLVLSIAATQSVIGARDSPTISVYLKNFSGMEKRIPMNDWLTFLEVSITGPSGHPSELTRFGQAVLEKCRRGKLKELIVGSGQAAHTEIPIGVLYEWNLQGSYSIRTSIQPPALASGNPPQSEPVRALVSNTIEIEKK